MVSAIGSGARVEIGANSGFTGTVICAAEEIVIGDNVLCGSNVTIVDADWHGLDPAARRGNVGATAPVRIEDDVFIGLGAIVLKGVTIGHGSVVGAGSVVTRSMPAALGRRRQSRPGHPDAPAARCSLSAARRPLAAAALGSVVVGVGGEDVGHRAGLSADLEPLGRLLQK